jgi:predicted membrane-bound spermidine synthase
MPTSLLYRSMVPTVAVVGCYLLAYGWLIQHFFAPTSYAAMFVGAALAVPLFVPIAYALFEKHEIAIIRRILPF